MSQSFDIAVIGAGIAGASIAAELAPHARVILCEAEEHPGYHTTGRSAAFREECYGGPDVVPLTLASGDFLKDGGYLTPRAGLYIAREGQESELDAFLESYRGTGVTMNPVSRSHLEQMLPGVQPEWTIALSQPNCADIDVARLHQHYLGLGARAGVELRNRHRLQAAVHDGEQWQLDFGEAGQVRAAIVVNAAGAWADHVARILGASPLGITPLRRTVAQLRTNPAPPAELPLTLGIDGDFYFRPENGRLWLSPHDETPSEPCDAAPDEYDIALAVDRFEQVVDWRIEAVERKWAGLRSFSPDRLPVYGFDANVGSMFWFAGQGGYGIQTAPAAARFAAQLLMGHGRDAMTEALEEALYTPKRFTT